MIEVVQNLRGLKAVCNSLVSDVPSYLSHMFVPFELMYMTGCRVGEAIDKTRWSYASNGDIRLQPLKGNYTRSFDIIQLPIQFDDWLNSNSPYTISPNYRQMQYYAQQQWGKFNIKIGNSRKLLHLFRHVYVKNLIHEGHSLSYVQSVMGHTHVENTESYATSIITSNADFENLFSWYILE